MGIRDDELQRMLKYAKGLGIKVRVHTKAIKGKPSAEWIDEEYVGKGQPIINLFSRNSRSKTQRILNFLHELGHHHDWVSKGRKISIRSTKATNAEAQRKHRTNPPIAKGLRKVIYEDECNGIAFMDTLYEELGLKFPKWKVYAEQEIDRWAYYRYYQTGNIPTIKETKEKDREIAKKWRNNV